MPFYCYYVIGLSFLIFLFGNFNKKVRQKIISFPPFCLSIVRSKKLAGIFCVTRYFRGIGLPNIIPFPLCKIFWYGNGYKGKIALGR